MRRQVVVREMRRVAAPARHAEKGTRAAHPARARRLGGGGRGWLRLALAHRVAGATRRPRQVYHLLLLQWGIYKILELANY